MAQIAQASVYPGLGTGKKTEERTLVRQPDTDPAAGGGSAVAGGGFLRDREVAVAILATAVFLYVWDRYLGA